MRRTRLIIDKVEQTWGWEYWVNYESDNRHDGKCETAEAALAEASEHRPDMQTARVYVQPHLGVCMGVRRPTPTYVPVCERIPLDEAWELFAAHVRML